MARSHVTVGRVYAASVNPDQIQTKKKTGPAATGPVEEP